MVLKENECTTLENENQHNETFKDVMGMERLRDQKNQKLRRKKKKMKSKITPKGKGEKKTEGS